MSHAAVSGKCHLNESMKQHSTKSSVGPAPSPVESVPTTSSNPSMPSHIDPSLPPAKRNPHAFKRHMPHYEVWGAPLFITFLTKQRWHLPPEARAIVLDCILHDHRKKMRLICVVVMPDHVHILYAPRNDLEGIRYTKTGIIEAIKSISARRINKLLARSGAVWQSESFDHVLRSDESAVEKEQYICNNPLRKGLCERIEDYPYLWRAGIDEE